VSAANPNDRPSAAIMPAECGISMTVAWARDTALPGTLARFSPALPSRITLSLFIHEFVTPLLRM